MVNFCVDEHAVLIRRKRPSCRSGRRTWHSQHLLRHSMGSDRLKVDYESQHGSQISELKGGLRYARYLPCFNLLTDEYIVTRGVLRVGKRSHQLVEEVRAPNLREEQGQDLRHTRHCLGHRPRSARTFHCRTVPRNDCGTW